MVKKLDVVFLCFILLVLLTTLVACQGGGSSDSGRDNGAAGGTIPSISGSVVLDTVESSLLTRISPATSGGANIDYSKLQAKLYDSNGTFLAVSPVTQIGTFNFNNVHLGSNYYVVVTNPSGTLRLLNFLEAISNSTMVTVNETSTAIGLVIEDARKRGKILTSQEVLQILSAADLEKIIGVVRASLVNASGTANLPEDPLIIGAGTKTDSTPPGVVSSIPASNSKNVATNTILIIEFSEAMDASSLISGGFSVSGGGESVSGSISFNSEKTVLTFTPKSPLSYLTLYTISVTKDAKDAAKNHMTEGFFSSFTTDSSPNTLPPTVFSVSPLPNAIGVASNTIVGIQFSEVMDITTLNSTNIMVSGGGINVPGTLSISADKTTATFTPEMAFSYSTVYSVIVSKGVKDAAGNPMTESFTSSFTVELSPDTTPPTIMNFAIQNLGTQTATILWETDEESSTQVDYGVTPDLGASSTLDSNLSKSHSVNISGLSQRTSYFLKVKSIDSSQNLGASTTTLLTLANTASFSKTISGLDTLIMQIQIVGVDSASFTATATIPCEKALSKEPYSVKWTKTSGIKIPNGIVLVSSNQEILSVKAFKTIVFSNVIPYGAIVQVFNKDTSSIVASDSFQQ